MTSILRFSFLAAAALAAAPAFAQDNGGTPTDIDIHRDSLTIGAAGVYLPDYEGSNDYDFTPAPAALASYKGFGLTLIGNRLSIDLIPDRSPDGLDFQAGPVAVVNFNRHKRSSIDDPRVKALDTRDVAFELGGYVGIAKTGIITSPYDRLSVTLSYRHDVSGVSDSGIWTPGINYLTPVSHKAAVGLFASAEHAGDGYGRAYFSVSPAESLRSGLPTYTARHGWKNYTIGALATVSLTGDLLHGWKLVGGGSYERLLNDFGDSPLVSIAGSRNQWLGGLGIAYTF